jgi:hypothetical protein
MEARKPGAAEGRWNMRKRDIGVSVWVAFLSASVGTFILFGLVDPSEIESAWMQQWEVSRKLAYSLGFLFLFLISYLSSWLTCFMIRTGPGRGHASGRDGRPPPQIEDPSTLNPDLDIEDIK